MQLACTLYEVSQAYEFGWFIQAHTGLGSVEERHFRKSDQSTPPKRLLSAIIGEVLVQKASHKSYQGYLFHQIIHIMSLSSPFDVSTASHISRSGYTLAVYPSPTRLFIQPRHPL